MTVTIVRGYASPLANQNGATGTPVTNQKIEAGTTAAAQGAQQPSLSATVNTQRVVSEAAVTTVRSVRSSSQSDKIRDPEKARDVATRVAEKIVRAGTDSAHSLEPSRAQPHFG